jgi:hypothetical protein
MNRRQIRGFFIIALILGAGWLLSPLSSQRQLSRTEIQEKLEKLYGRDNVLTIKDITQARRGGAYTGVILYEVESQELYLDTTPCQSDKIVVPFQPAYVKEPAKPARCGAREYKQSLVTQK